MNQAVEALGETLQVFEIRAVVSIAEKARPAIIASMGHMDR